MAQQQDFNKKTEIMEIVTCEICKKKFRLDPEKKKLVKQLPTKCKQCFLKQKANGEVNPQPHLNHVKNEEEQNKETENVNDDTNGGAARDPQKDFKDLVSSFYKEEPWKEPSKHELEIKFGTINYNYYPEYPTEKTKKNFDVNYSRIKNKTREEAIINRTDYDNVFKKLLSMGFTVDGGELYSLRILQEYVDNKTKEVKLGNIRIEINGLDEIQTFCTNNDIDSIWNSVVFNQKQVSVKPELKNIVRFFDFNFSVSYKTEEFLLPTSWSVKQIRKDFNQRRKTYRYINRVTLTHPDYPVKVDLSIVKSSKDIHKRQRQTYMNTLESGVFTAPEKYEIEIEVDNTKISPFVANAVYKTPESILLSLKKVIRIVLSGIQASNYPIGFEKKGKLRMEYNDLFKETSKKDEFIPFIGPNPVTLQLENIQPLPNKESSSSIPNIRQDYVVTEKADGERNMLYISKTGEVFLMNMMMDIRFTGAKSTNPECFHSLIDGELITQNKDGEPICLFAAFDLYFYRGKDMRLLPLIHTEVKENEDGDKYTSRFKLLRKLVRDLNCASAIVDAKQEQSTTCPIAIIYKQFYPRSPSNNEEIFDACNKILSQKEYIYKTDGLIFTPASLCVGGEKGKQPAVINKRSTWQMAFKWKPPEFNTVDFLVSTIKNGENMDEVLTMYEPGTNNESISQVAKCKPVKLKVSYSGFFQPCEIVIKDDYTYIERGEKNEKGQFNKTYPVTFTPTDPQDFQGGVCIIPLNADGQMVTEDGTEVFSDNTIVEFKYVMEESKGWVPIRVRYDKTNMKNYFGNSYAVAESNWKSIHYPVTENMLKTGDDINPPSLIREVYYNEGDDDQFNKVALRLYHNYYKTKLIESVTSKGRDTLIDLASGRGGDLPKWIKSKYNFVLGIDLFQKGVESSCGRYVHYRLEQLDQGNKSEDNILRALFVQGDASKNIRDGNAFTNDMSKAIVNTVFKQHDMTVKEATSLGIGNANKIFGIAEHGFHVTSCQFAIHYFFENLVTLRNFVTNVAECTKLNGYFIGTTYDGLKIFNMFKALKKNAHKEFYDDNRKLVSRIEKKYDDSTFQADASSLGKKIGVYQESIGQDIDEYLVNFEYFKTVMGNFGFVPLNDEDALNIGFKYGSINSFEKLRIQLNEMKEEEMDDYHMKIRSVKLSEEEKELSKLSNYFIFQKRLNVLPSSVILEEVRNTKTARKSMIVNVLTEEKQEEEPYRITKLDLDPMVLSKDVEDTSVLGSKTKKTFVSSSTTPALKKKKTNKTDKTGQTESKKQIFYVEDSEEEEV